MYLLSYMCIEFHSHFKGNKGSLLLLLDWCTWAELSYMKVAISQKHCSYLIVNLTTAHNKSVESFRVLLEAAEKDKCCSSISFDSLRNPPQWPLITLLTFIRLFVNLMSPFVLKHSCPPPFWTCAPTPACNFLKLCVRSYAAVYKPKPQKLACKLGEDIDSLWGLGVTLENWDRLFQ